MPIRNKVQPGERRIFADEYNAFLAMTQQAKLGIGEDGFSDFYQASRAYIKNDTIGKVFAFGVLGLSAPVIPRHRNATEFFGAPTFTGTWPNSTQHKGKFAILQEPAMPGETVRAVIAGATWAWLDIVSEDDTTAEIVDNATGYLRTGTDGSAKILWKEAGTGPGKAGLVSLNVGAPAPGIPFRNDSGETIPPYAVMKVVDQVDIGGTQHLTVNKPDHAFQRRYLVNAGAEVANTAIGSGNWLEASAPVRYDESEGDPNGEEWGAWPGQWSLKKQRLGFTLFKKTENGIALGSQREVVSVFGKLYEDLEQGGEADFRVWMKYDGQHRDTQMMLTAHDWYMNRDEEMKKDTKAEVAWYSNEWRIRNAYCSEDDTDDAPGAALAFAGTDGSGFFVSVGESPAFDLNDLLLEAG